MQFGVLGPLEARADGSPPLALGGPKQRALLALLLLHRNEVVSLDRLLDGLWGERPPATAVKMVQVYVSRLRKLLSTIGGDGCLATQSPGYALRVGSGQLDLDLFREALERARQAEEVGDTATAAQEFRRALAFWRGPALADLLYERFAGAAAQELEEERLAALEARLDADLRLGRHAQVVGELAALAHEHPYREGLRTKLVVALYRSGRQTDALAAYREARQTLLDELGVQPGPELAGLEGAILRHDPTLGPTLDMGSKGAEQAERAVAPTTIRAGRPGIVRRRRMLSGLGAAACVGVLAGGLILAAGGGAPVVPQPNSVSRIDPSTDRFVASVALPGQPAALAVEGGKVWAIDFAGRTYSAVDARTGVVVATRGLAGVPTGIAAGLGSVWITGAFGLGGGATVVRVDPTDASIAHALDAGLGVEGVAVGARAVWVADREAGTLVRIDPATNAISSRVRVGSEPEAVAVGGGSVWVADPLERAVWRIDARTSRVRQRIPMVAAPSALAYGGGALWVASRTGRSLTRLEADSGNAVTTLDLAGTPSAIAVGAETIWVGEGQSDDVVRVDPRSNRVVARLHVNGAPSSLPASANAVWVGVNPP